MIRFSRILRILCLLAPITLGAQIAEIPFGGGAGAGFSIGVQSNSTCPIKAQLSPFSGGGDDGFGLSAIENQVCPVSSPPSPFSGGMSDGNNIAVYQVSECIISGQISPFSGGDVDGFAQWKRISQKCDGPNLTITDLNPRELCEGDSLTITGTLLNNADLVVFAENSFTSDFINQDSVSIQVLVPVGAVSGTISVSGSDGTAFSAESLQISPLPVAGFDYNQDVGFTFEFTSTAMFANNYFWDFGENNTANGQTASFTFPGNGTYPVVHIASNACGADTLISELVINTTGISKLKNATLLIVPNPFREQFEIRDLQHGTLSITLYNMLGQLVYNRQVRASEKSIITVDTRSLVPGIYSLHISGSGVQEFRRLIRAE